MTAILIVSRAIVSALIVAFVGLAFVPHFAAERLTALQIFLTDEIDARRRSDRGRG